MNVQELQRISPANYFYDVRDQLKRHIYARTEAALAAGDAARDAIRTPAALRRRQAAVRRRFLAAVGGPLPACTPLHARITGEVKGDGFRVEKVIFQSRPKAYVTANLYVPAGLERPTGAVLFFSGHEGEAKHAAGGYPILAQYLTRAGLVVLVQDPPGQGERYGYYEPALGAPSSVAPSTTEHQYVGVQCSLTGRNLAYYFLHDAMRGLDYLRSRPEVIPDKIGATGASGGGLQTAMLMVSDPRLACAAPGMYVSNRLANVHKGGPEDAEQVWSGLTAWGFDHEDFLLMMCPRPVCVLAAKYDFFPIEGTRRTVARSRRFWGMLGRSRHLGLAEDAVPHSYSRDHITAAAALFSQHLLGRPLRADFAGIKPIEPASLWCTKSGQVRGELAGARTIADENRRRVAELARQRRRQDVVWLRGQVLNTRKPCDLNLRLYLNEQCAGLRVQMGLWWSQEGIFNHGFLFSSPHVKRPKLPVSLAVWDDGVLALHSHQQWIQRTCAAGRAVLVLETTGVGSIAPNPMSLHPPQDFFGVIHTLHNWLDWLGDSLAALRTWDVLRALDVLKIWPGVTTSGLHLYASGKHGLCGRLAAALDSRITAVKIRDGIRSYADLCRKQLYDTHGVMGVVLPGVLEHLDLTNLK